MKTFARVSPLPFFLVPGVRIGRAPCELSDVAYSDVIRGEETEVMGFQASAQKKTSFLELFGGHFGYGVHPPFRGRQRPALRVGAGGEVADGGESGRGLCGVCE